MFMQEKSINSFKFSGAIICMDKFLLNQLFAMIEARINLLMFQARTAALDFKFLMDLNPSDICQTIPITKTFLFHWSMKHSTVGNVSLNFWYVFTKILTYTICLFVLIDVVSHLAVHHFHYCLHSVFSISQWSQGEISIYNVNKPNSRLIVLSLYSLDLPLHNAYVLVNVIIF